MSSTLQKFLITSTREGFNEAKYLVINQLDFWIVLVFIASEFLIMHTEKNVDYHALEIR